MYGLSTLRARSKEWLLLPGRPQEVFSKDVISGLDSEYRERALRWRSTINKKLGRRF